MDTQKHIEKIVAAFSAIKDALESISSTYAELPAIVEAEHQAIARGAIDEVTKLKDIKEAHGETLSLAFEKIRNEYLAVRSDCEQISGQAIRVHGINDIVEIAHACLKANLTAGFGSQVLAFVVETLEKAAHKAATEGEMLRPFVDRNKVVLEKCLQSALESRRFWSEIRAEVQGNYNSQGLKTSSGSSSLLHVKA